MQFSHMKNSAILGAILHKITCKKWIVDIMESGLTEQDPNDPNTLQESSGLTMEQLEQLAEGFNLYNIFLNKMAMYLSSVHNFHVTF